MTLFSSNTVVEIKPKIYGFVLACTNWGLVTAVLLSFALFMYWLFLQQTRVVHTRGVLILFGVLWLQTIMIYLIAVLICIQTRYVVDTERKKIRFIRTIFSIWKKEEEIAFSDVKNVSIIQLHGDSCILYLYLEYPTDGFVRAIVRKNLFTWPFSSVWYVSESYLGGLPMSTCLEIVEIIQRDADIDHPAAGDK